MFNSVKIKEYLQKYYIKRMQFICLKNNSSFKNDKQNTGQHFILGLISEKQFK